MRMPFLGVVEQRPYPATGLTTARWAAEVPVEDVLFADLWLTQGHLRVAALFGVTDRVSDTHPHVVVWRGARYLEDGHHRVTRAALVRGVESMPMRVFVPAGKKPAMVEYQPQEGSPLAGTVVDWATP